MVASFKGMRFCALSILATGLVACASNATDKANPAQLNSGDSAKKAFLISDAADSFEEISAGDALDCRSYAVFVGLRGRGLLEVTPAEEKMAAKDVSKVWSEVFDRKTDPAKREAIENRQARVDARTAGTLEKLGPEKCVDPVLEKLGLK
ncbi:MAG: hypothetical protein ABJO36_08285 [Litorimonas sp.]